MAHHLPIKDIKFIADFAAYARSRGDVSYCFLNSETCALAQFGHPNVDFLTPETCVGIPQPNALCDVLVRRPRTFSALADRLEALIADAPKVQS